MKRPETMFSDRYLYVEVILMIERLINLERPHGKSEYRKLSEKIVRLKQQLCGQLNPQVRATVRHLLRAERRPVGKCVY